MSAKILIVDDLATNRIILKARLSSAYYHVVQAGSGEDALKLAATEQPDLLLVSANLPDMASATFMERLRQQEGLDNAPVVLLLPENATDRRFGALQCGASDVFEKPLTDTLLMAKLRSLLRQKNTYRDLQLHVETAEAFGFSDVKEDFMRQGRVVLISPDIGFVFSLREDLEHYCQFDMTVSETDTVSCFQSQAPQPDVFVLCIDDNNSDANLRLMAELLTNPNTRHCRIIAQLHKNALRLAPTLLDLGAHDVISETIGPDELALRLKRLVMRKLDADQLRTQLHSSLQAAVIDPLTGLYNRRYAIPYLTRMIATSATDNTQFAVMVADLDHFKRVNDTYGHMVGDSVLARIAALLKNNLSSDDVIARIGGEEFLIIIPNTTRTDACGIARRLCQLIQRAPIHVNPSQDPVHVTISIGVTLAGAVSETLASPGTLFEQADSALYDAKAEGRNTVTLSKRTAA